MASTITSLLVKARTYLPADKLPLIEEAYQFAEKAHNGQFRLSGSPYIEHPLEVALLLADLRLDASTIASALLHDVVEDCKVSDDELERRFGSDVRKLVDGVTKLSKIEDHTVKEVVDGAPKLQAESLRKMLVAMAEDIRVVLIKLADRLHNMKTIRALPPEKRARIARETLDVYAPLAHRLGIANFKWQLEDLAFRCLHPDDYKDISRLLATNRAQREAFIRQVVDRLRKELKQAGIKAEVSGRPKHLFSIFQKTQRYAAQGRAFDQIHDLFAARLLVEDIPTCYAALGVVHNIWHPIPGQFDDYISSPRENMYQSLHTTVMGPNSQPFEVQIRTYRMHEVAEYGIAAHFRYKEGAHGVNRFDQQLTWIRQLLEFHREEPGTDSFLESVKTDIFPDQVFVYTPKGEVRELPVGATAIDFAYRIHTELGHRCTGAKVNGNLVPLDTQLKNGDTVEVLVSKTPKGPSLDWLNPDMGYVRTANARDKIRAWFRKRARAENIEQGRALLEKEMRRLHISLDEDAVAKLLGYESQDELLSALGSGGLSIHQLAPKLLAQAEAPVASPADGHAVIKPTEATGVMVMGMPNMLTRLAKCCHPLAGDRIIGFITRSRGVTVHRGTCRNLENLTDAQRRITVSWGVPGRAYTAKVAIEAWDRVGLLRDITTLVSKEKVNIAAVRSTHRKKGTVIEVLTLETADAAQLSRLLSQLEKVKDVVRVTRVV